MVSFFSFSNEKVSLFASKHRRKREEQEEVYQNEKNIHQTNRQNEKKRFLFSSLFVSSHFSRISSLERLND